MSQLFDETPFITDWSLADRFVIPPISVLDARNGTWQQRKADWDSLQLESRVGRGQNLTYNGAGRDPVSQKLFAISEGTSTFDPVLAELIYRWWSPADGVILDPFAGGSTRGLVASVLGRDYHGIDLSPGQVAANYAALERIGPLARGGCAWHVGDSAMPYPEAIDRLECDAVVSCPPYGTLEKYSDNPADLSTMDYRAFRGPYSRAITRAVHALRPDRFAVFVVGNYREGGKLRDLVGMTIDAFEGAGAEFYADLMLVTMVGTASVRASATFDAGRKPIRSHQYVLVFVKGDWRRAAAAAEADRRVAT